MASMMGVVDRQHVKDFPVATTAKARSIGKSSARRFLAKLFEALSGSSDQTWR